MAKLLYKPIRPTSSSVVTAMAPTTLELLCSDSCGVPTRHTPHAPPCPSCSCRACPCLSAPSRSRPRPKHLKASLSASEAPRHLATRPTCDRDRAPSPSVAHNRSLQASGELIYYPCSIPWRLGKTIGQPIVDHHLRARPRCHHRRDAPVP